MYFAPAAEEVVYKALILHNNKISNIRRLEGISLLLDNTITIFMVGRAHNIKLHTNMRSCFAYNIPIRKWLPLHNSADGYFVLASPLPKLPYLQEVQCGVQL